MRFDTVGFLSIFDSVGVSMWMLGLGGSAV